MRNHHTRPQNKSVGSCWSERRNSVSLVRERLSVVAIPGCNVFYQFVECTYPNALLIKILDESTIRFTRRFGKQRFANTTNAKLAQRPRRKKYIPPEIRFMERVRFPPFSLSITTALPKQESLIIITLETLTKKRIEGSATNEVQDISYNTASLIIVANSSKCSGQF